ncbi:hypothetical protein N7G274_007386 [Stereocaulon virgatum]|uniref:Uncharacterized protein n=1 Tax=Stereocaulon virgatum TaxID=373712 RepID=A0ABR4A9F0_9LECA
MSVLNLFHYSVRFVSFALAVSAVPVISAAVPAQLALSDYINAPRDASPIASQTPAVVTSSDMATDAFKRTSGNVTEISVKPQLPHHFRYAVPRTDLVFAFLTLNSGSTPPSPDLKDVISLAQREAAKEKASHGEEPVETKLEYDYRTARFKLLPRPGLLWTTWGDAVKGLLAMFAIYKTVELRFNLEKAGQDMGVGFLRLQDGLETFESVPNLGISNVTSGAVVTE